MKVRMLRRAGTTYQATIGNPRVVALITAAGIAVGVIAWLSGERGLANGVWSLVTAIALVPLLFVALVCLGLIFTLWMKTRLLQKRIEILTWELRTFFEKSGQATIEAEPDLQAIQEKKRGL